MTIELDESCIAGKYESGEINTVYSYVSIPDFWSDGSDLYLQGEEACEAITEIFNLWDGGDMTQNEAIEKYKNIYSH